MHRYLPVFAAFTAVVGCSSDRTSGPPPAGAHEYLYVLSAAPAALYGLSLDTQSGALTALSPASLSIGGDFLAATPDGKTLYISRAPSNGGGAYTITRLGVSSAGAVTVMDSTTFAGGGNLAIDTIGGQAYLFTDGVLTFSLGAATSPGLPSTPVGPPVSGSVGVSLGPTHCLNAYTPGSPPANTQLRLGAGGALIVAGSVPTPVGGYSVVGMSPSRRLQFIVGFTNHGAIVQSDCSWALMQWPSPNPGDPQNTFGILFGTDSIVFGYEQQIVDGASGATVDSAGWNIYRVVSRAPQDSIGHFSNTGLDSATFSDWPLVDPSGSYFIASQTSGSTTVVRVYRINSVGTWTQTQSPIGSPPMGNARFVLPRFAFVRR